MIEQYAIKAHADTNHYYDTYLPYEFHLRMVVKTAKDFIHLIPIEAQEDVIDACWLHDTIEDARKNYKDIVNVSSVRVAEIVRAVTNNTRGRNRKERNSDLCYSDMRNTPYATFVKLCDRIANVQYSKMTGSSMFEMYRKEMPDFYSNLYEKTGFDDLWLYLQNLFTI